MIAIMQIFTNAEQGSGDVFPKKWSRLYFSYDCFYNRDYAQCAGSMYTRGFCPLAHAGSKISGGISKWQGRGRERQRQFGLERILSELEGI